MWENSSDRISLRGLEVYAFHGCMPQEKTLGQKFIINADLMFDLAGPARNDDLKESVNYARLCEQIKSWMGGKSYDLIETAADLLARKILVEYPIVRKVCIEIEKPHAPAAFHFDTVFARVERARHTVYLSLGSNMGSREENIADAIDMMDGRSDIDIKVCSQLYETKPYGFTDQPDFINACAQAETILDPAQLLEVIHVIEKSLGRERLQHWGPRTVDIDIIFYDDLVLDTQTLHIPHIDMQNRMFVLKPLAEIAPYIRHPYLGKTVSQMLSDLPEEEDDVTDLGELREKIDGIDSHIVSLIEKRIKVSEDVARYKIGTGKPVYDPVREREKIDTIRSKVSTDFNKRSMEALFNQIMTISRSRQYELIAENSGESFGFTKVASFDRNAEKVCYQGVEGAYGHQAAKGYFGDNTRLYHVETFADVLREVSEGRAEYGVLPIENSSTGIITDVYDLLSLYDICVTGEYVVKVDHVLLGLEGARERNIKTVFSHPQGLMQCSQYLSSKPDWNQISLKNTAVSARRVLEGGDPTQAAIAGRNAAQYYHLSVLKDNISDTENNSTKFIIIKKEKQFEENANDISITFELRHESGSLYHILGFIIYNHLNMNKIESRPIKGEKWKYRFFIDFDGNLSDAPVRDALKGIEQESDNFKILGNYIQVL